MIDNIIYVQPKSRLTNRILINIIKDKKEEIKKAIKCNDQTMKRLLNNKIATKIYDIFVRKQLGKFLNNSTPPSELPKAEAIFFIKDKMTKLIQSQAYRVKILRGVSFNDFVFTKKKHKVLLDFLPLMKPDIYFDNKHNQYYIDNQSESHSRFLHRIKNADSRKFVSGNNHYVDGYCYSNPKNHPNVHIVDYNRDGKTDLHFKIAGTSKSTSVRIRKLKPTHRLLKSKDIINKLSNKVVNLGGNARVGHNSHVKGKHFMFSMCHHKQSNIEDQASVPVRQWNSVEPTSLSTKTFGFTLESAIATHFAKLLSEIKNIEKNEEVNYVGNCAHSIDISVNLVNAAHFDMGDAGYGCGLWLSSDGKPNDNWYFILPNASIKGSRGVAIKLDHGIMIEWNGKEIKHCSSDPGYDSKQMLFGTFVGPKKKYSSKMRNVREEPIIPEDFTQVINEFKKIFK